MKKSLLFTFLIVLIGASNIVFGQATNIFPQDGNVGIGTLSPTEKLSIKGNVVWDGHNSGNSRAINIGYSGGNYGGIGYNIDFTGTTGIFNRPLADRSSYLEFRYGGFRFYGVGNGNTAQGVDLSGSGDNLNLFATITSSGNFGIGTENPTHKLTVEGDIKLNGQSRGLSIEYATLSETGNGASTILGNNVKAGEGNNTIKRFISEGDPGSYMALNYSSGITFHTGVTSALNAEVSSTDNEVMRITQLGNVGIGTIDTKGYKLAVNGNIRSKEIKVEVNNWPDYVFEKSYPLLSLQETAKHIKQKGSLPGIPSAEEVKANGIDLGEMNAKLLKKIEEVTLHLIDKDNEVRELKQQIQQQEVKINLILKKLNDN